MIQILTSANLKKKGFCYFYKCYLMGEILKQENFKDIYLLILETVKFFRKLADETFSVVKYWKESNDWS